MFWIVALPSPNTEKNHPKWDFGRDFSSQAFIERKKIKIRVQTLITRDCKGPQANMPENVGSIKTWSAKMKSRHIKFSQAEYCNADRTTWKLTLQDINTTPKETKPIEQEVIASLVIYVRYCESSEWTWNCNISALNVWRNLGWG